MTNGKRLRKERILDVVELSGMDKTTQTIYPYQLLNWQPNFSDIMSAMKPFIQYNSMDGIIVFDRDNKQWSIFTTGEYLVAEPKTEEEEIQIAREEVKVED